MESDNSLTKTTPLSKYLGMALFIALPFIGGWIGYTYAPEKEVDVIRYITHTVRPDTLSLTEVEERYEKEIGSIQAIYLREPLTLTGVVEPNYMGSELIVKLDTESVEKLPPKIPRSQNGNRMMFQESQRMLGDASTFSAGTKVRFTIADYHYDTRHVETYDSGILLSIEKI